MVYGLSVKGRLTVFTKSLRKEFIMNAPNQQHSKPFVFVTPQGPDDGGDFGPQTPGTMTSGIQEALDYAHEHCRDVYIFGGRGGMHGGEFIDKNVYRLQETLRVPWSQDFRLDGGNYLLAYEKDTGDAVTIDSQMNCRYKFGIIGCRSVDGVAVRIRPHTKGPDDFSVIIASVFDFSAVCSKTTSIVIDPSEGSIVNNKFFAEETNSVHGGLYIKDSGEGMAFLNNSVHILFTNQEDGTEQATGMRIGDPGSSRIQNNWFESVLHAPRGVYFDEKTRSYRAPDNFTPSEEAIGLDLYAQNNRFRLAFALRRAPGKDIVFREESRDNLVHAFNLPHGFTNLAKLPTNKVTMNRAAGFEIQTPDFPQQGTFCVNRTCFQVQVFITDPGELTGWTLEDAGGASQSLAGGFFAGQSFLLDPGDKVRADYTRRPQWKWKAML